jgi:hypothetical protein
MIKILTKFLIKIKLPYNLFGKQTPMNAHPYATSCRGCRLKWHRIEKGGPLKEDEIGFVVELVMGWIHHSPHYSSLIRLRFSKMFYLDSPGLPSWLVGIMVGMKKGLTG